LVPRAPLFLARMEISGHARSIQHSRAISSPIEPPSSISGLFVIFFRLNKVKFCL
jgi:hypothetical protein